MNARSRHQHVEYPRTITLRHVWLAGIGMASSSVRNVRNARDIAGTAVERIDYVQRRAGQRIASLRREMWAKV